MACKKPDVMWQEATHNVLYPVIISVSFPYAFPHFQPTPISSYSLHSAHCKASSRLCTAVCLYWDFPPLLIRSTVRRKLPL